jgi:hypothetical protein
MLQLSWHDRKYHRKPIPKPAESRKARHKRRVQQREEWRTALGLWAIGAHVTQERALLDVGLREGFRTLTASEKLRQLALGGPVVRATRHIAAACGTEVPVGGKLQTRVSQELTKGLKVRERRSKAAREVAILRADTAPSDVYVRDPGSLLPEGVALAWVRQMRKFGSRVIEVARKTFTPPRGAPPKWIHARVEGNDPIAHPIEFRRSNKKAGQQADLIIGVNLHVFKYWRHGLQGVFGPKSLIIRAHNGSVMVVRQKGPHTYVTDWEPAPELPGENQ